MVEFQDLQTLLAANALFDATECVDDLEIDQLEIICARVLASDPLEPLAYMLAPVLAHARELQEPDDETAPLADFRAEHVVLGKRHADRN